MKPKALILALGALIAWGSHARSEEPIGKVYNGSELVHGTLESQGDGACGELLFNADGTYENGYCWRNGGIVWPYFGAFAECYSSADGVEVCAVVLDLTQVGTYFGQTSDIYVWADAGGEPGNVICFRPDVDPGAPAFWPSVSRHTLLLEGCCVSGDFWAGYWSNWPLAGCGYFIAADLDGPGGCPYTNIAHGIGFPSGWQDVSVAWGPTAAVGIGTEIHPCSPTPNRTSSWGRVKDLYRH